MGDTTETDDKKQGTRVFKKSSHNGKITTYLCKRDFIDSLTHCDPIEGVVLVDPEYVQDRKVFTHVLAAFRYGREDLDVLGLTFRKDLYLASVQVYPGVHRNTDGQGTPTKLYSTLLNPPVVVATAVAPKDTKHASGASFIAVHNNGNVNSLSRPDTSRREDVNHDPQPLTRLQERLIKKLGSNAYPFYFKLPPHAPASVMLQPSQNESGKPCGVDYELRTYMADEGAEKLQHRNSVRLAIRKLTYAPEEPAPQPSAVIVKDFLMSPGSLRLELSLDKEKYYHGESICVNVLVDNNSNKTVKKIRLSVVQVSDITLFSRTTYRCTVDEAEFDETFPILPSQTGWCKVYHLRPLLSNNRHKRGLALDGKLKHEDTNLASSTIICSPQQKETLGMIVQYRVKARLVLGFGASDVSLELPFTLTHPKPAAKNDDGGTGIRTEDFDARRLHEQEQSQLPVVSTPSGDQLLLPDFPPQTPIVVQPLAREVPTVPLSNVPITPPWKMPKATSAPVQPDEDDLIFEDFARLRLKSALHESELNPSPQFTSVPGTSSLT